MIKNNKKKGFTLVELLVVIAIIAILATVSVVSYLAFVNRAHESNDISLTTQMNTVLTAENAVDKVDTMSEAVEVLADNGIVVDSLSPASDGYYYVWDRESKLMFLLDENKSVVSPEGKTLGNDVIAVAHNDNDVKTLTDAGYGVYLASDYTGTSVSLSKLLSLDAGSNQLSSVTIDSDETKSIYVAGNISNLTLDTPNASVEQYGEVTLASASVADNSLHINGYIMDLTISKGRVVVEAQATVDTVVIPESVTVTIKVELGSSSASIGAVVTNGNQNVELPSGVETVTEVAKDESGQSLFAGGAGTEKAPYLISIPDHFANISEVSKTGSYYYRQINDLSLPENYQVSFSGVYDGDNHILEVSYTSSSHTSLFNDINGHATFKNIKINQKSSFITMLLGLADWGTGYGCDFENIEIVGSSTTANAGNIGFIICNAIYTANSDKEVVYNFKNIVNNVDLENGGTCTAFLIGSGPCFYTNTTLNFENCVNNGNILGTSSVGFLYGNSAYLYQPDTVKDPCHAVEFATINVKNCKNNGVIMSVSSNATVSVAPKLENYEGWAAQVSQWQSQVSGLFVSSNYLDGKDYKVYQNGNTFGVIAPQEENITYKVMVNVYALDWRDGNVTNGVKIGFDLEINESATYSKPNSFYAYDYKTALEKGIITSGTSLQYQSLSGHRVALYITDDCNYLIFEDSETYVIDSNASILLYSYYDGALNGIDSNPS